MKTFTQERKWKSNIPGIHFAHIVEEQELMILRIFMFAPNVKVRELLWKLRDLDQVLSNNSRHNVINVEVKAKPYLQHAIHAEVERLSRRLMSCSYSLKQVHPTATKSIIKMLVTNL